LYVNLHVGMHGFVIVFMVHAAMPTPLYGCIIGSKQQEPI
jgi:hypothetical protein